MINKEELVIIGKFGKPHGTKGEITFSFTNDAFTNDDFENSGFPFFICEIDGIFVPFRIEDSRIISDSLAYIQLRNIDSDQKARQLVNKEVFFPEEHIDLNNPFIMDYFIDFMLIDERLGEIGRIIDIDMNTINILFVVERGKEEILIPAVEELFILVDEDRQELTMALPIGLLE